MAGGDGNVAALTLKVVPAGDAVARVVVRSLAEEDDAAIGQFGGFTSVAEVVSGEW